MTASLILTLLAILAGLAAGELLCGVLFNGTTKDTSNKQENDS